MRPEYLILIAVAALALALLTRRGKPKPRTVTTCLPDIDQPDEVLTMHLPFGDGTVPVDFCLDVQRATHGGLPLGSEFWQRYTDTVDLAGLIDNAHEAVNLGHDESLRSHRGNLLPAGPAAPTLGQGIARGYFPGHPDLPEELHDKHIVVLECFDKTEGIPVLYPDTARELPTEGVFLRNVLRHVSGDTVRCRYTYHYPDGVLLCDSGWVVLQHSQPLAGTDVGRFLWPAKGVARATDCEVTWSERELLPLVPAAG